MFVEEYLEDLRGEGFRPAAILRYLRHVGARSRDHMVRNPGAVRSIWSVALGFFAATFLCAALLIRGDRQLATGFFLVTAVGIFTAFAVVTLYVGALRDSHGYAQSALPLATVLTLLRTALVPGITLFLLERRFEYALIAFTIAAATDVADGWIARRWNQITRLGTVLDPLVDIVFSLAVFAGLTLAGLLPGWVFALGALRYAVLVVGGVGLYLFVGPVKIQPTLIGRLTGVLISALAGLLMLLAIRPGPLALELIHLTRIALGVLLGCTVIHVVVLGWYNLKVMSGQANQRGRVVGDVRWGAR